MSSVRRITDSRGKEWKVFIQEATGAAANATQTDNAIGVVVRMERSDERHVDIKLRGRSFAQMSDADLVAELEAQLAKRRGGGGAPQ